MLYNKMGSISMCKQLKHVTKAILLLVLFISCQIGASTNLILSPAVAPNPFSPNQDGIKDKLYISFQCAKPWSMWQINILNNTNGSVASMAGMISNTGLSIETNWDGTDQDGILQPDGHYKYTIDLQSDIEAPITSLSISGPSYQTSDHTVYASSNTVFQLTSSDLGTPTSGISEIFYSFDAIGFFSSYQNAFSFKENGDKTLFFFAVDNYHQI